MERTHASFFSGVGGLDLGLERAGWRTVSFSEIDPYASAVLAERWPGVPNLGDITAVASQFHVDERAGYLSRSQRRGNTGEESAPSGATAWRSATLWTGGFPCQDLSVAGKRRGMGTDDERTRSGLAYAFLDLVERHRPPAILLENVPGLLSSNAGKDFGALLGRLGELGYWWAYRILDAQFFGVPQRRRRVFICALHAGAGFGADSAAAVLSVGSRCGGHSQAGDEARPAASDGLADGSRVAGSITANYGKQPDNSDRNGGPPNILFNATASFGEFVEDDIAGNLSARDYKSSNHLVRPSPDSDRVREADGLAGRLDGREVVAALDTKRGGADDNEAQAGHLVFRKAARVSSADSPETWVDDGLANTLNSFDVGDIRTTHLALNPSKERDAAGLEPDADPLGLDSHRYRCCGNGVVSNVAEWIGVRLARAVESVGERAA